MDFYSPQTAKYDGYFDIRQNDIIIVTWCLKTINFLPMDFLIKLHQLDSRLVGKLTSKMWPEKIDEWQSNKSVKWEYYEVADLKE